MHGRWPVVYVAIIADDALPSEELEYSDNVVVELDDICVASEECLANLPNRYSSPC